MVIKRFDVYMVKLDPTVGSEIQKTRPCVVVTPDEMNANIRTVIVAPMTSTRHTFPSRIACDFQGKQGHIALDHLRSVDKKRFERRLGRITIAEQIEVLRALAEMFAE
jgi:mRNA interferase MazF